MAKPERRLRFKIRTKITLALMALSILCLVLFGYVAFSNVMEVGNYASQRIASLGESAADDSTKALEALGQKTIEEKAVDVSKQAAIYVAARPRMTVADLQKDPEFRAIAVQNVGNTGYTSIMDLDSGYFYFHPQQQLVNTDTHQFAQTLPAVWKILEQTIDNKTDSNGYYDWKEADGSIRPKYMALALMPGATGDERRLFVAATTYIDEFSMPAMESRKRIQAATDDSGRRVNAQIDSIRQSFSGVLLALLLVVVGTSLYLSRSVTRPVLALTDTARSIERGETFQPERIAALTTARDELADLARVFGQMATALEKRAADERVAAEQRYRNLFDRVPVGLYRTAPSGEFLDANPALANTLGYAGTADLIKSNASDIYGDPAERSRWLAEMGKEGTLLGFEAQLRRQDGSVIWTRDSARTVCDSSGRVEYYEGTIEDITQRKMAEEKLRQTLGELEHQYRVAESARGEVRAILDAASDAMMLVSPDSQVLSVNRRFGDLLAGVELGQLVGNGFELFQEDIDRVFSDPAGFLALVTGHAADPQDEFTQSVAQKWPQTRELQVFSTPVHSADGEHLGRLYVFHDVTREREVDRMKTEFVSLVSHELRTPLTSIKGYVDLLIEGEVGDVGEDQREFLGIIKSNADRLVALINDLLDISRIESGRIELKRTNLDLGRVIQGVVATLRQQIAAKDQHLTVEVAPDLPAVPGDGDRVTQIITNFVSNAYKYTPAGGDITVRARALPEAVLIEVQDSGIGLTSEEQKQLFTKFFRVKNRVTQEVGGTGLGLAITRSLIEMHGGEVRVSSAPGKGSTFGFTLPAGVQAPAPAPAAAATPEAAAEISAINVRPGGRILVVDDEPDIANLIRRHLEHGGYDVIVAASGAEAFRLAHDESPDLITLDIKLPDVDGFTVLEWLKNDAKTALIPVIMLSTMPEDGRGRLLGAIDYVPKPAQEGILLERVGRALSETRTPVVLIAEDDADVRRLLAGYLHRAGYQVLEAGDGRQALELARQERPGLILMDVRMPGMDGISALRELRADPELQDLPVVVMTASPDALQETSGVVETLGISALLGKPFTAEDLAKIISHGMAEGDHQ